MKNIFTFLTILTFGLFYNTPVQAQCGSSVTSVIPAQRCGEGTVTLQATSSAGSSLNWYAENSGQEALGTGTSFNTPEIKTTTNYYVATYTGSTAHVGASHPMIGTNWGSTNLNSYQTFTVTKKITLVSVTVYPTENTSIKVGLANSSGTVLQQSTFSLHLQDGNYSYVPFGGGSKTRIGSPVTLTLNFTILPGSNYRLVQLDDSSRLVRNLAGIPSTAYDTEVNGVTITGNWMGSGNVEKAYWYNFYDWVVSEGCESARTMVTATVTPAPEFTISPSTSVCSGQLVPLNVTSNTSLYDSYKWTPVTNLYTDAQGTTPYTGGSATTVYAKATSSTNGFAGDYKAQAKNSLSNCAASLTSSAVIYPSTVTLTSTPAKICSSGVATLSLSPSLNYSIGNVQWQQSTNTVTYKDITGANSSGYVTPALTASGYFRVLLKNSSNNICHTVDNTVPVAAPAVVSANSQQRCGSGSLQLSVALNPGADANWYSSINSTEVLSQSNIFNTPSLNSSKIYYVLAKEGACSSDRVPVTATINPLPVVSFGDTAAMCPGIVLQLGAHHTGDTYIWSNGETSKSIYVTNGGKYAVTATFTSTGCSASDSVFIKRTDLPTVSGILETITNSTHFFAGSKVANAETYHWDFGDGQTSNLPSPSHAYQTSGTFTVTLCITNGCRTTCTDTGSNTTSKLVTATATGIDELAQGQLVKIYPNPTADFILIEANNAARLEAISVYAVTGALVKQVTAATTKETISVKDLAAGMYLLHIQTAEGIQIRKVEVSR